MVTVTMSLESASALRTTLDQAAKTKTVLMGVVGMGSATGAQAYANATTDGD